MSGILTLTARELDLALRFIDSRRWQFARTMAYNPHEYTVRKWVNTRLGHRQMDAFVKLIYTKGYRGKFGKRYWPYIDIDGWTYFTFGSPLQNTTPINRKPFFRVPADRASEPWGAHKLGASWTAISPSPTP